MNAPVEAADWQTVQIHIDRSVGLNTRNPFIDPATDATSLPDEFGL
jgi:hypothetical protein